MPAEIMPLTYVRDFVMLAIRLILGTVMIYYGFSKIKDMKANAKWFSKIGFKPGMFWGTIVMLIEFFGGIFVLVGFYSGFVAALFGLEMILGAIWKITKTKKPFTDWSYDIILLGISLSLMAFGPGRYSLAGIL